MTLKLHNPDSVAAPLDDHPARDLGSTMRCGAGTLVHVHSAYLRRN